MPDQEEINQQLELLQTYRRTLAHYLRQKAIHGDALLPAVIAHGIDETSKHIQIIKQTLRSWNIIVEDRPDDVQALSSTEIEIEDGRRRVNSIRSRQDAMMSIAWLEASYDKTQNRDLLPLLAEAKAREEQIRKRENRLSSLEQRNDLVSLLNELETLFEEGAITITINGQVRDLASYIPLVRGLVRTAMTEKADEYLKRANSVKDQSPTVALRYLRDARSFPELSARKIEQIDDEIIAIEARINSGL